MLFRSWALALFGVLNSVVSLFYYARVMKAMYLEKAPAVGRTVSIRNSAGVLATITAIPILVLGVFWQPLAELAAWSAQVLH